MSSSHESEQVMARNKSKRSTSRVIANSNVLGLTRGVAYALDVDDALIAAHIATGRLTLVDDDASQGAVSVDDDAADESAADDATSSSDDESAVSDSE